MNQTYLKLPFLLLLFCLVAAGVWGGLPANPAKAGKQITPRQLVQPGALMGSRAFRFRLEPFRGAAGLRRAAGWLGRPVAVRS